MSAQGEGTELATCNMCGFTVPKDELESLSYCPKCGGVRKISGKNYAPNRKTRRRLARDARRKPKAKGG